MGREWAFSLRRCDIARECCVSVLKAPFQFFCCFRSNCRPLCVFWAMCTALGPCLWGPWCLKQKYSSCSSVLFSFLTVWVAMCFLSLRVVAVNSTGAEEDSNTTRRRRRKKAAPPKKRSSPRGSTYKGSEGKFAVGMQKPLRKRMSPSSLLIFENRWHVRLKGPSIRRVKAAPLTRRGRK